MECLTEERDRGSIVWRKDGEVVSPSANVVLNRQTLQIFNVERENYGMYQCFVTRGSLEVEARGELRLGGRFKGTDGAPDRAPKCRKTYLYNCVKFSRRLEVFVAKMQTYYMINRHFSIIL